MTFTLFAIKQRVAAQPQRRVSELVQGQAREKTFAELAADVDGAVAALQRSGVRAGMRVGFLAENCYEWIVHDLALIELRCVAVALAREVVGGDLERTARTYRLHLIVAGSKDPLLVGPRPPWIHCLDQPQAASSPRDEPLVDDPEYAVSAWVFSSGSSGRQRCIETSRPGIEAMVSSLRPFVQTGDRFVVFLPMSNLQQRFLIYGALWFGVNIVITEPLMLFVALKKYRPTVILAPPIFYETIANRIRAVTGWKGLLLRGGLALIQVLRPVRLHRRLARLLSAAVRENLGGQVRLMITGMAPINRATLALFEDLDLPLYEAYGMTECGIIACNLPGRHRLGSVGALMDGVKVTVAADGELLVQVPTLPTRRYLFEDEATRSTFVGTNTIATGDIGRFDGDGFLYLRGRKNNVIVLPSGAKVHPEVVEAHLEGCPALGRAVVTGMDGQGLTLLLSLNSADPEAEKTARDYVQALNARSPQSHWIARVVVTATEFTRDNGLLTTNLKLNRKAIAARFSDQLSGPVHLDRTA